MNSFQLLRALACGVLMLAAAPPVRAEGTFDIPAGARFNPDKLAKITEFFKNEVATGKIAGANVLIRQRGKDVYHETFGVQDVTSKTPISDKTIFRLSSLTKAITSVVAMQIDPGRQDQARRSRLEVHSFLREYEGRCEKKAEDGAKTLELVALDPANHHSRPAASYLRHHLWLLWRQPGAQGLCGSKSLCGDFDLAEFAERIAKLPLHNQPGALWRYGHSTDILGADHGDRVRKIIARARAGKAARSARHDRHRLLRYRTGEAAAARPAGAERQQFPGRPRVQDRGSPEVEIRQRRHGFDHGGLFAICADAAQWRNVRGQDLSQPRRRSN